MTIAFTNEPLHAGVTPIRAVHFTELRSRIDGVRVTAGVERFAWTDPILTAGGEAGQARASRGAAVGPRLGQAGGAALARFRAVGGKTPIRAAHLMELRAAVVALEQGEDAPPQDQHGPWW